MKIIHFRPKRPGPESTIEAAVASQILKLFPSINHPVWTASSIPIGSSMPDLIRVSCEPEVFKLSQVKKRNEHILAYLRLVSSARIETLARRMRQPVGTITTYLNALTELGIVSHSSNVFSLSPIWRNILPEIVTIEAKATNWRKGVQQAARNCVFCHRSYVALPDRIAQRVRLDPIFKQFGLGLLAVQDNQVVRVVRRCRRRQPRIWSYYYRIASLVAMHFRGAYNAIPCSSSTG